jgi:hypothetical protein
MKSLLLLPLISLPTLAQTPAPSVAPAWDIAPVIADFSAQAARVKPILDQLTPEQWVSGGAPKAYVAQWQSARQETVYVANASKAFEGRPEKLTLALDAYFRWEALQARLATLAEGVRKYQDPAMGDLLVRVVGDNSANRDRLRQYIADLAAQKEEEFTVADQEAQRCRGTLSRQAPAKSTAPSKTPSKAEDKR